jgi:GNAT superfamily N-acetyltransferase
VSGKGDIHAPEAINRAHDLAPFDSGVPALDEWLRRRAIQNQETGASRTYVITSAGRVVGYYALAAGAVAREDATPRARRNMPDTVPVMVIGRLAVDRRYQGHGFGRALMRDAVLRTLQAADIAGIRVILVHAMSDEARRFYESCGFRSSPVDPMTLMITLDDARHALLGKEP